MVLYSLYETILRWFYLNYLFEWLNDQFVVYVLHYYFLFVVGCHESLFCLKESEEQISRSHKTYKIHSLLFLSTYLRSMLDWINSWITGAPISFLLFWLFIDVWRLMVWIFLRLSNSANALSSMASWNIFTSPSPSSSVIEEDEELLRKISWWLLDCG